MLNGHARSILWTPGFQVRNVYKLTGARFQRGNWVMAAGYLGIIRDCSPDGQALDVMRVDRGGSDLEAVTVATAQTRLCFIDELPPGRVRLADEICIALGYLRRP